MKVPVLESVFLNRSPIPESRNFGRVLVLGRNGTGMAVEDRLTKSGYQVVRLDIRGPGSQYSPDPEGGRTVLDEVHGFAGCFEAVLNRDGQRWKEPFGFIVAAQESRYVPKFHRYGLAPGEKVVSLSELESLLGGEGLSGRADGAWFHAVFLVGLEGDSDPVMFQRVFDAIDTLGSRVQLQPYVFTRQVKVAAEGLERRYRQLRERGTLFFKFDDRGPGFRTEAKDVKITFTDPVLNMEMELVPDLIVVDEDQLPPSTLKPLLDAIPSSLVTAPFLQPESTRFSGVLTQKAGVLAVGAYRGNFGPLAAVQDAEALVVALKTSETPDVHDGLPGPPLVDQAKCTICLTCVRLCPHGAMTFHKRAEADPASCVRCGICAAECPMDAIRLAPPASESSIAAENSAGVTSLESTPRIMAFLCSRSAARAMKVAGPRISNRLTKVILPCAGTLNLDEVISAFRKGIDGVLVGTCHTGNCASIYGNVLAQGRVSRAALVLEEAGIDPGRLALASLASNTPGDFARAVSSLEETIRKLRPYTNARSKG